MKLSSGFENLHPLYSKNCKKEVENRLSGEMSFWFNFELRILKMISGNPYYLS